MDDMITLHRSNLTIAVNEIIKHVWCSFTGKQTCASTKVFKGYNTQTQSKTQHHNLNVLFSYLKYQNGSLSMKEGEIIEKSSGSTLN
jgi:hypothetical protein